MDLVQTIRRLANSRKLDELEALVASTDVQLLSDALCACIHQPGVGTAVWNAILSGYAATGGGDDTTTTAATDTSRNSTGDLFRIVRAALDQLNRVEVPQKQSFDIVIRLFAELGRFDAAQLIELCEYCVDSLRLGDPKCTG